MTLSNGFLFRFKLSADRQHFTFTDPRLADLVADNVDKFDITESESLLIGRDFGITTDIQTGAQWQRFVVSLSNGAVYEIKSKPSQIFVATLTGSQQVPASKLSCYRYSEFDSQPGRNNRATVVEFQWSDESANRCSYSWAGCGGC